ncbi:hypothetical protein MTO96_001322 [Rhipicephalus appendiculatus]
MIVPEPSTTQNDMRITVSVVCYYGVAAADGLCDDLRGHVVGSHRGAFAWLQCRVACRALASWRSAICAVAAAGTPVTLPA